MRFPFSSTAGLRPSCSPSRFGMPGYQPGPKIKPIQRPPGGAVVSTRSVSDYIRETSTGGCSLDRQSRYNNSGGPASRFIPSLSQLRSKTFGSEPRAIRSYNFHRSIPTTAQANVSPFKLHDIGEGITEVEIIRWYVTEGQEVQEFDALCEVQSDKSVVELTSHAPGIVKNLKFDSGQMVKVGQVLCEIHSASEGQGGEEMVGEEAVAQTQTTGASTRTETGDRRNGEDRESLGSSTTGGEESSLVTRAERLSESLEKGEEHQTDEPSAAGRSDARAGEQHPLFDPGETGTEATDLHTQQTDTHPASLPEIAAEAYLAPSLFSGEAAILPTPPSRLGPSSTSSNEKVPERRIRSDAESTNGRKDIIRASPAVRTLASRLGVDLSELEGKGTGDGGRVTKGDVEAAAADGSELNDEDVRSSASVIARGERENQPQSTRIEFGRTRKAMYRALGAQGIVPHFGYSHTLDLTPLLPYLKAANAGSTSDTTASDGRKHYQASDIPSELARDPLHYLHSGTLGTNGIGKAKTTLLSFLVKAMILAMEEHPIMRSRVKEQEGQGLGEGAKGRWLEIAKDGVIGVAVSDPKHGLLTPALPALPPSTSLQAISSHLSLLRQTALKPSSGPQANLTISSVGGLGECTGAMPVIPPGGGLAICAVGRAKWEVEWCLRDGLYVASQGTGSEKRGSGGGVMSLDENMVKDRGMRAVLRVPVGWSGDHRILEGAELIAFTESWKKYIERPWTWLHID